MIMDKMAFLWFWSSLSTSAFVFSDGRTIPFGSSVFLDKFRSRRSLLGSVEPVLLPLSMIDNGLVIYQTDEIEKLVSNSRSYGTECPGSYEQLPENAPLYARSNCPWFYVRSKHDPNRFPASLPEAVSKCRSQCLGLPNDIVDDFACDYVFSNVTVLVREYHNNIPRYIETIQHIPVGSTCVRRTETT
ncbi:uncharacterized protein LOC117345355 [Pecten maximus]|uniref:uncharacterized protein LOC117345355 n=1 Tax=Pecten maximus TaxID=6579 RepID=UPI001458B013|nr:uncharacterized protein LOC117345355 [Pecten maximus]